MRNQRGFTLIELLICLAILFCIAAVGGMVYVAIHFIAKFW